MLSSINGYQQCSRASDKNYQCAEDDVFGIPDPVFQQREHNVKLHRKNSHINEVKEIFIVQVQEIKQQECNR